VHSLPKAQECRLQLLFLLGETPPISPPACGCSSTVSYKDDRGGVGRIVGKGLFSPPPLSGFLSSTPLSLPKLEGVSLKDNDWRFVMMNRGALRGSVGVFLADLPFLAHPVGPPVP